MKILVELIIEPRNPKVEITENAVLDKFYDNLSDALRYVDVEGVGTVPVKTTVGEMKVV